MSKAIGAIVDDCLGRWFADELRETVLYSRLEREFGEGHKRQVILRQRYQIGTVRTYPSFGRCVFSINTVRQTTRHMMRAPEVVEINAALELAGLLLRTGGGYAQSSVESKELKGRYDPTHKLRLCGMHAAPESPSQYVAATRSYAR